MKYRIEWMWNGNWRMEDDGGLTFDTKDQAQAEERKLRTNGLIPQFTRIVEVQ